jgi:hypothetical protein
MALISVRQRSASREQLPSTYQDLIHIPSRSQARVLVHAQKCLDELATFNRDGNAPGKQKPSRPDVVLDLLGGHVLRPSKRRVSAQELECQHTKCPPVHGSAMSFAGRKDLWRHVLGGSAYRVRPLRAGRNLLAQAKISEHNVAIRVSQEILKLSKTRHVSFPMTCALSSAPSGHDG